MKRRTTNIALVGISASVGLALAFSISVRAEGTLDTPSAAVQMAVFDRASSPQDALPTRAADLALTEQPAGVPDALYEGNWQIGQSRLLAATARGASLYAVPTDRGAVCYAITAGDGAGGGCVSSLDKGRPLSVSVYDPDEPNSGVPPTVGGLVSSDTDTVKVLVNGEEYEATVQNNAYLYSLVDTHSYPSEVIVSHRDGSTATSEIPDPRSVMEKIQ